MNQIPTRIAYSAGNETLVVSANPIIVHAIFARLSLSIINANSQIVFRDADNTTLFEMKAPGSEAGTDTGQVWQAPTLFDNGLNFVVGVSAHVTVIYSESG